MSTKIMINERLKVLSWFFSYVKKQPQCIMTRVRAVSAGAIEIKF